MANPSNSQSYDTWVRNALSELLVAPHISFRDPPGIRLGPGPIDVFSTKFNNIFSPDAKGVVAGEQVDREGLKEKLLALQRHYNPDSVKFHESDAGTSGNQYDSEEARFSFTWISKDASEHSVSVTASVTSQEGINKIIVLTLDGQPQLFTKSDS